MWTPLRHGIFCPAPSIGSSACTGSAFCDVSESDSSAFKDGLWDLADLIDAVICVPLARMEIRGPDLYRSSALQGASKAVFHGCLPFSLAKRLRCAKPPIEQVGPTIAFDGCGTIKWHAHRSRTKIAAERFLDSSATKA